MSIRENYQGGGGERSSRRATQHSGEMMLAPLSLLAASRAFQGLMGDWQKCQLQGQKVEGSPVSLWGLRVRVAVPSNLHSVPKWNFSRLSKVLNACDPLGRKDLLSQNGDWCLLKGGVRRSDRRSDHVCRALGESFLLRLWEGQKCPEASGLAAVTKRGAIPWSDRKGSCWSWAAGGLGGGSLSGNVWKVRCRPRGQGFDGSWGQGTLPCVGAGKSSKKPLPCLIVQGHLCNYIR